MNRCECTSCASKRLYPWRDDQFMRIRRVTYWTLKIVSVPFILVVMGLDYLAERTGA